MTLFNTKGGSKLGKGKLIESGITDPECMSMLAGYRRSVASSYSPLLPDQLSELSALGQMHVSPKIDGELWFLIFEKKSVALANSKGTIITGDIPILDEASSFAGKCSGRTIIAGELFVATKEDRPRVGGLAKAMGGGAKADVDALGFAAFDVVAGGDKEATSVNAESYADKLGIIERILDGGKRVKAIKTEETNSSDGVASLFDEWVENGKAEGLVVRTSVGRIYKVKPSFTIDAVIIGYTEKSDDAKQARSIALALMREDETFQFLGSCGNLGDAKNRKDLMKKLSNIETQSHWKQTSGDGALYRFVKPEIVVEIKATDVQGLDANGNKIQKMALGYEGGTWSGLRKLPCASVLHPVFAKFRTDKDVNTNDIRLAQLSDRCFIPDMTEKAEKLELPKSKVVRREVYSKEAKGSLAVRKLVIWKTNKEDVSEEHPAFVVHWTDYSAGRKKPLAREVRLAPNEKAALKIGDGMIEKNIKKGWTQVVS